MEAERLSLHPGTKRAVIVGAGPVGLALAIDLVLRGIKDVVLLDERNGPSTGSRAICWSRRTLEIMSRLGVGKRLMKRGVTWQIGRVFHGDDELFHFDLQPEPGYSHPAFINLSQNELETILIDRLAELGHPGILWDHKVTGIAGTTLALANGKRIVADWVVAADGARSPIRDALGLVCQGRAFEDRFLIADVRLEAGFANERRFWFHPSFHQGNSALLHRQPDNVFRIDLQLGRDADPAVERQPERIIPRLEKLLGDRSGFELIWSSVYAFQGRRLARFVHDHVIFVGDSAHQVSPFGARGGNGGIQDADNLAWKLAMVVDGLAPASLLDSYDAERVAACDENILHSTRATDFMSPKAGMNWALRDAVLHLAPQNPFARGLINSGRLSVPAMLDTSPLNGPDVAEMPRLSRPGAPCPDAPLGAGWLIDQLGEGFVGLYVVAANDVQLPELPFRVLSIDGVGQVAERYGGTPGSFTLVRPDQHVAARFRRFDREGIMAALAQASGG